MKAVFQSNRGKVDYLVGGQEPLTNQDPSIVHYNKINFRWNKELYIKCEAVTVQEQNLEEFSEPWGGKSLFKYGQKNRNMKEKTKNLTTLKKDFY